jgi:hypothetical protein
VKIVAICGAGIGSSGIPRSTRSAMLQATGPRSGCHRRTPLEPQHGRGGRAGRAHLCRVRRTDRPTNTDVIVIESYFGTGELALKLKAALD